MSELRATTISDTAGTGPVTLTGQSAAKASAFIDMSVPSLVHSFNVSSLDDNGTGDFDTNYTNNFSESTPESGHYTSGQGASRYGTAGTNYDASFCNYLCTTLGGTANDDKDNAVTRLGDLA